LAAFVAIPTVWTPADASAKPKILATIAQLGEPMSRILGACATVETLLGPGVDPHLYRLTRSDAAKALAADALLANGLNLEAQMRDLFDRLSARKPVIYAGERVDKAKIIRAGGAVPDPHIWMDPRLWPDALAKSAAAIAQAFPACALTIAQNQPAVLNEIMAIDAYIEARVATLPPNSRVLATAHDAFGYFGKRYGMTVLGVQGISTESEAGVAHIRDMAQTIHDRRITAVFVETSTAARAVDAVIEGAQALGAVVNKGPALFSDAMGPPGTYEGTYIGMLDHNATAIVRALGGEAPERGLNSRLAQKDTSG
jgi:manganese/zinc/iron transport system substrate-binding protein